MSAKIVQLIVKDNDGERFLAGFVEFPPNVTESPDVVWERLYAEWIATNPANEFNMLPWLESKGFRAVDVTTVSVDRINPDELE